MVTKQSLSQFTNLRLEVTYLHNSIVKARRKLKQIEQEGAAADMVTGGYGGSQRFKIEGFPYLVYSRTKTKLLQDILLLEKKEQRLLAQTNEIYEFIDSMENPSDRMVFTMIYIDGLTQQAAANRLHMDQGTVSRTINKFFKGKKEPA